MDKNKILTDFANFWEQRFLSKEEGGYENEPCTHNRMREIEQKYKLRVRDNIQPVYDLIRSELLNKDIDLNLCKVSQHVPVLSKRFRLEDFFSLEIRIPNLTFFRVKLMMGHYSLGLLGGLSICGPWIGRYDSKRTGSAVEQDADKIKSHFESNYGFSKNGWYEISRETKMNYQHSWNRITLPRFDFRSEELPEKFDQIIDCLYELIKLLQDKQPEIQSWIDDEHGLKSIIVKERYPRASFYQSESQSYIESDEEDSEIEEIHTIENIILYGPPGTGKTHKVQNEYIKKSKNSSFITFHQSYSYEDFVEGIKPELDDETNDNKSISYKVAEGIFKQCCNKALELLREDPSKPSMIDSCKLEDLFKEKSEQEIKELDIFKFPIPKDKMFYLCIDEINRGNVSAIFGELITLIEPSKRLGQSDQVVVKLPYSKKKFGVPPNLQIIGTMNTADRSVEALDTALRRRFTFEEMMPNCSLLDENISGLKLKSDELLKTINSRIEVLLDRDHTIGHSYFMKVKTANDLISVFSNQIIPLLQEYFYNDYEKIAMVLGHGFVEKVEHPKSLFSGDFDNQYDLKTEQWHIVKINETNLGEALKKLGCIKDNTPSEST
jgi:hypothetical protein